MPRKVHFVGIGGVGMSGLAQVLLQGGDRVSGSDLARTAATDRLRALGASVQIGHAAAGVVGADLVVYSSSIAPQNPELVAARHRGIPVWSRGRALATLLAGRRGIAVGGSHGKTTTTAMIASVLVGAGRDPTMLLGGEVERLGGNARVGGGPHVVVEADESDGLFVYLAPSLAVITNIEAEHLDYYRNDGEILHAYQQFADRLPADGLLIAGGDDPGVQRLRRGVRRRVLAYGLSHGLDLVAESPRVCGRRGDYLARYRGRRLGTVTLQVPGLHNVVNSLAAIGVGLTEGVSFAQIRRSLAEYSGAGRRFQARGEVNGVLVIEDYAHHPTEIAVTLQAARTWAGRRVFCVFQPHRFSRTKYLRAQFGTCFSRADALILTDVYAASEDPVEGIGADSLSQAVRASGYEAVEVMPSDRIVPHLLTMVRAGDLVLVLGAGDIGRVAGELVQALKGP